MHLKVDVDPLSKLRQHRARLHKALEADRSPQWCLRLWGRYVRARDGQRCVCCKAGTKLQAHHIVRKSLYPWGTLELGNGITLCADCHNRVHAEFNGRPNLTEPIGRGDDQDEWAFLFGLLYEDCEHRNLDPEEFYFIGDHMLLFFVRVQGYQDLLERVRRGEISRIRFAHEIWRVMPDLWYTNVATKLIELNL